MEVSLQPVYVSCNRYIPSCDSCSQLLYSLLPQTYFGDKGSASQPIPLAELGVAAGSSSASGGSRGSGSSGVTTRTQPRVVLEFELDGWSGIPDVARGKPCVADFTLFQGGHVVAADCGLEVWRDDSRARRRIGAPLWDGSVRAQLEETSRHSAASIDADAELRVNFLSTGNRFGRCVTPVALRSRLFSAATSSCCVLVYTLLYSCLRRGVLSHARAALTQPSLLAPPPPPTTTCCTRSRGPDELLASERAERGDRAAAAAAEGDESRGAIARKWARAVAERGHELESHIEISVEGSAVRVALELSLGALDALVRVHGGVVARASTAAAAAAAEGCDAFTPFSRKRYPLALLLAQAWGERAVREAAARVALDSVGHAWARATHDAAAQARDGDCDAHPPPPRDAVRGGHAGDSDNSDGGAPQQPSRRVGAAEHEHEHASRVRAETDRTPATLLPPRKEAAGDGPGKSVTGSASSSKDVAANEAASKKAAGEGTATASVLELLSPAHGAAASAGAAPDADGDAAPYCVSASRLPLYYCIRIILLTQFDLLPKRILRPAAVLGDAAGGPCIAVPPCPDGGDGRCSEWYSRSDGVLVRGHSRRV